MSELKSNFLNEMKKLLKRSNLDIFSILFMLDILGYCFLNHHDFVFSKNHFIRIILKFFAQIFSNKMILIVCIVCFVMLVSILLVVKLKISLPNQTFVNGKVVGYSPSKALRNIFYLLYYYVYYLNILYLSMIMWFNQRPNLSTLSDLEFYLVFVDTLVLISKLIRSIFQYSYKIDFIKEINDDEYFDGGYFILSETKINNDRDVMILKDKIMSNHAFYVVMREKIYNKNRFSNKSFYKILDSSLNFEDIKYAYEYYIKALQQK